MGFFFFQAQTSDVCGRVVTNLKFLNSLNEGRVSEGLQLVEKAPTGQTFTHLPHGGLRQRRHKLGDLEADRRCSMAEDAGSSSDYIVNTGPSISLPH